MSTAKTKQQEMNDYYFYIKSTNNASWRPKCIDCNYPHTMIKCHTYYKCMGCGVTRYLNMTLRNSSHKKDKVSI